MKTKILFLAGLFFIMTACAQFGSNKDTVVTIHTSFGDMKVILFDETPIHKSNFIELAESGQYDSTTFHRIIKNFMVQGGDIDKKTGNRNTKTLDAEIVDGLIHGKGMLAAARLGDNVNPEKKSSYCQFYIVQGSVYEDKDYNKMKNRIDNTKKNALFQEIIKREENEELLAAGKNYQAEKNFQARDSILNIFTTMVDSEYEPYEWTEQQQEVYSTVGGAPHLDGDYTVFGKVIDGLNVIDSLAVVKTKSGDAPYDDHYLTMEVEKMSKKKITKQYGYEYPN